MPSENTSPQAGTRTAGAADSTQPLAPVKAPEKSDGASSAATNGAKLNGAKPTAAKPTAAKPTAATSTAATSTAATPATAGSTKPAAAPAPAVAAAAPSPSAPDTQGSTSSGANVKDSAVKAAAAALAAARSAAKKVQSTASSASAGAQSSAQTTGAPSSTPPPPPAAETSAPRPEMHYAAGGVHGTAQHQSPEQATQSPAEPQPASGEALGSPRRVRLSVSRIDPWSIMKLAFLLSVAIAVMTVVATIVVWHSLNSLQFFATVQEFMVDTLGPQAANLTQFVQFERVVSLATLIALVNIVLMTAIATIIAMLYNITAALVGGVHLTLTDE